MLWSAGEDVEWQETLVHCGWEWGSRSHFMRQPSGSLQTQTYSRHTTRQSYSMVLTQSKWKSMPTQNPAHECLQQLYSCQHLEAAKTSFSRRMDKQTDVHPDKGVLFSTKKWATKLWKGTSNTYYQNEKPIWKSYILHDSKYMIFWK